MATKNVYSTNYVFIITIDQRQAKLLANKIGNCRICMSNQENTLSSRVIQAQDSDSDRLFGHCGYCKTMLNCLDHINDANESQTCESVAISMLVQSKRML